MDLKSLHAMFKAKSGSGGPVQVNPPLVSQHVVTFQPPPQPQQQQRVQQQPPPPQPPSQGGKVNSLFCCDPCGKSFRSKALLDSHILTHEPCSHPGCTFSGSQGALKEHRLIHTAAVQRLINMTPEEIEQWREERRKNWPSEENMKRKKQEQEEEKTKEEKQGPRKKVRVEEPEVKKAKSQSRNESLKAAPRTSLLKGVYSRERTIETDLLLQCFEFLYKESTK